MSVKAFAVVGYKKTGKTTLVCRLVAELKNRGYKVGTLKHDAHDFRMDFEGSDTYKHRQAGADVVAIASSGKWTVQAWPEEPPTLEEMLSRFEGVDLVLVEGFKQGNLPKIVIADEQGAIFQNERLDNVVAVAMKGSGDLVAPPGIPVYHRDDIGLFVELILTTLALK
ncbi:molybdopterin-guanine dinucleotide biosynthesis protein B [Effusibacillus lacus]|uniref:Molybdopterin-guanine dinucleotide biosynthesis protein MobB n=1 Tax=Effusibacillus lacus TaxID=1348429 RepID=A0A292YK78_9BACL|nr:molybdopterin-guanine dinucleotide biosynthesis protein B [Effusibacillus lacus]TCS74327.1 molybdopterin guanine dinucleotide biosynthesis accessory protein MobB [Effusibacillus lacus]GAX88784.1 molybdopterin-guanine dinucleotide biosynthesis protein MobB [Effusibacillus lacus]